jgi:hypothetical protein
MARRLWGCYSVADHLERRAFVADLLLYDRLVVPVPAPDDLARWEAKWDPERQQRLLDILGGFAERMAWTAPLRDEWEDAWYAGDVALDIDASAPDPDRPYALTRRIISEQLQKTVELEKDVRGVAVYAKPDRFDREWRVMRTFPFVRRATRVQPGPMRQASGAVRQERHELAKLVVTRLVVPDDGRDDEQVLQRTVDLVSRGDVAESRAKFHELLGSLDAEGLEDETILGEVEDLLDEFNAAVQRHTTAQRARVVVQVLTTAEGCAALWAPPVALAAGPTAAAGEALISRRWGGGEEPSVGAVALLAEAQEAVG